MQDDTINSSQVNNNFNEFDDETSSTIDKTLHSDSFTCIYNETLNNRNLSGESLAVLVYLCGKPNNWIIQPKDIQNRFQWGRDKIRKIFQELSSLGYMKRHQKLVNNLRSKCITKISDKPIYLSSTSRLTDFQATEVQSTENQSLTNIDIIQTKKVRDLCRAEALPPSDSVIEVFEYWQQVMNHPKAKLLCKRHKAIKKALKDGYSVADLKKAVDGCKLTPWNMGLIKDVAINDDIELIVRNETQIDRFCRNADHPLTPPTKSYREREKEASHNRKDRVQELVATIVSKREGYINASPTC